jgi:hypothetical protein
MAQSFLIEGLFSRLFHSSNTSFYESNHTSHESAHAYRHASIFISFQSQKCGASSLLDSTGKQEAMAPKETVIVTGFSQGIGAAAVQACLEGGYSVVGTSRDVSGTGVALSPRLELVNGDSGLAATG